jgi:hypothetical protein
MPRTGWGAAVEGEPADISDWVYLLKEPFDPWIEVHGNDTVLRSVSLDELTSAGEVRDRAIALIERLNGAIAVCQEARPLRLRSVIQFAPDGQLHRTIFAEAVEFSVRSSLRATATVIGADGKPVPPPPPQPSEVQQWALLAERDDLLDDALIYFGRATDWFDIYKALECLMLRFGGERAFLAQAWQSKEEIVRLKQTANWSRHAKRKFDPPQNPMELKDARGVLGQLLRRAFKEAGSSRSPSAI